MVKKLITVFLLICSLTSFAQDYDGSSSLRSSIIPPSPNAFSISRYGNIPVNLYTGVPSITADIYTIREKNISVPVFFSYHASGIKVQDVASSIGLGWSLQAGGLITRVVRGLPDEVENGYCGKNGIGKKLYETSLNNDYYNKVISHEWDSEPDIFYYNFLGKTGRFVLNTDGGVVNLDDNGLKLSSPFFRGSPMQSGFQYSGGEFVVTDLDGASYYFGSSFITRETTISKANQENNGADTKTFDSSWYLTKIKSINGSEVNFTYENGLPIKTIYYINAYKKETAGQTEKKSNWNENLEIAINSPIYLKSITWTDGSLDFKYKSDRLDITNGKYLEAITLNNKRGKLRDFLMNYSYFYSDNSESQESKRLKLNSVIEKGAEASIIYKYRFEYNTNENLPPRNSVKIDHWGYYNNNPSYTNIISQDPDNVNRNPFFLHCQANILSKISFPTGGNTTFIYEQNDCNGDNINKEVGGLRIRKIINNEGTLDAASKEFKYKKSKNSDQSSGEIFDNVYGEIILNDYKHTIYSLGTRRSPIEIGEPIYALKEYSRSFANSDLFDLSGTSIGYSYVTTLLNDGSKIESAFTNFSDYRDVKNNYQINAQDGNRMFSIWKSSFDMRSTSYAFKRGLLLEESFKDNKDNLVKKTTYSYDFSEKKNIVKGLQSYINSFLEGKLYSLNVSDYEVFTQNYQLKSVVDSIFDSPKAIGAKTVYQYDTNYPFLTREVHTYDQNNNIDYTILRYKYPVDFQFSFLGNPSGDQHSYGIKKLLDNNMLSTVIEKQVILKSDNEYILSGTLNTFRPMAGIKVVADQVFGLETIVPILVGNFISSKLTSQDGPLVFDNRYKLGITYNSYDSKLNLTQSTITYRPPSSYKWGYNTNYPIAEIQNASDDEVFIENFEDSSLPDGNANTGTKSYPGDYPISFVKPNNGKKYKLSYFALVNNSWEYTVEDFTTQTTITKGDAIDDIRIYPEEARITTTTFIPLIGVTSAINNDGKIKRFEYDDLGRLRLERDQNNDIIKQYKHNYICSGEGLKFINGGCEQGVVTNITSWVDNTTEGGMSYHCKFYYKFSDGSIEGPYTQSSKITFPCSID